MSYDLEFLRKGADESWEEAFEAVEDDDQAAPDAGVRAAVTAAVRELLGDIRVHEGELYCELDHQATGIQLNLYRHSAAITVPYWYTGPEAATIVGRIYELGGIVERHTGLIGYDPQVGLPVAEAATRPDLAVKIFDQTAAHFAQRGIITAPNRDAGH
jgi:hypothetical protein